MVDQSGIIFAPLFHKIGAADFPSALSPLWSPNFFGNWNIPTDVRISKNMWAMESPDGERREFFEVVPQNLSRARGCLALEKARTHSELEDLLRGPEGNTSAEPSGDELIPQVYYNTLLPGAGPDVEREW